MMLHSDSGIGTIELSPEDNERYEAIFRDMCHVINKHSGEQLSNTPDFILAAFLTDCLLSFHKATNNRTHWFH